jgi:hypothetical protein
MVYFTCLLCGSNFESRIYSITNGNGCNICKNKTQKFVYEFIKLHFGDKYNIISEYKPKWSLNKETNQYYRYDIALYDIALNIVILIEIDGMQHYFPVKTWNSYPEEVQKNDIIKMNLAFKNNCKMIRLYQPDIYYNKLDWKSKLLEIIDKLLINFNNYKQYLYIIEKNDIIKNTYVNFNFD